MNPWYRYTRSLMNKVGFITRSKLNFSIGPLQLKAASKEGLFPDPAVRNRELELIRRYEFHRWQAALGRTDYQLNLFHLDLLDTLIRPAAAQLPLPQLRLTDVGSRTFYYLPALYHFFRTISPVESLHGIELDAYRRYPSGYTAYDFAQAYRRELGVSSVDYLPMDFLLYHRAYNVGTFLLPFVTEYPLLHWGLPLDTFHPVQLFEHAWRLLERPGLLIIANKGEEEQRQQHQILDALGIVYEDLGPFSSPFFEYDLPRYVSLVVKR